MGACKLDMWFEVSSNFMFHNCSEFRFWATIPSRVCPSTDSCCVSYMNTGTLRASWTCGLKSDQTSCSMIVSEFKFWATIPSRVCLPTDSCCVSYVKTRALHASWACGLKSAQTSCSMNVLEFKFWATIPSRVCPSTDSCCVSYVKTRTLHASWTWVVEVSSKFMLHDCLRVQALGYHSVKGLPIDGFVLCLLYEDENAARKLVMWFEVSSNFMIQD